MNDSFSVEELLEAAQDAKITYTDNEKKHDVRQFIEKFNIQGGEDKVYMGVLELLYRSWTTTDVYEKTFHKYLKKFLPYQLNAMYYTIDKSLLNITEKELVDRLVKTMFRKKVVREEEEKEDKKEIRRIRLKKTAPSQKRFY